ncbi:Mannosyl trans2 domain containing protein [Trichuris trichiura]|uniref:GPI mannosyltransferase 2 n=1 Tax=Trichuris trichiura TaxID=36087 RepID=A0A077YZN7_TRITR|nr:Mannosyl trans2 domain containing protein [Trichuris trichiura]
MPVKAYVKKRQEGVTALPLLLQSCFVAWLLQFIFNHILADHNAEAFRSPQMSSTYLADRIVDFLFSGYTRWDSQHFLHIATVGYTFENNAAFFPFLPGMIRLLSSAMKPWISFFQISDYQLGIFLYRVMLFLDGRDKFCRLCVVLHCLSPATVFFHSIYSESLFALWSYAGMDFLFRKRQPTIAALLFSLSVAARSNGLVNILFLFFYFFQDMFSRPFMLRHLSHSFVLALLRKSISLISRAAVVLLPFLFYQLFIYWRFCLSCPAEELGNYSIYFAYAQERGYNLLCQLDRLDWCHYLIPFSYSAIQKRYWNVGLLGYYQWKKLPCFLLSLPTFCLFLSSLFIKFPLLGQTRRNIQSLLLLHSCFLVCYVYACCNVEILTRLLFSCSPLLYWQAAQLIYRDCHELNLPNNLVKCIPIMWSCSTLSSRLILCWFLIYAIVGIALHSNFFPWT